MNDSTSTIPTPKVQYTKVLAKTKAVKYDSANESATLEFLAPDNKTIYSKIIFENGYAIDDILENLGAKSWKEIPLGHVVQLVFLPDALHPSYINACSQVSPYRPIWKPRKEPSPTPAPQPEMTERESDQIFSTIIASCDLPKEQPAQQPVKMTGPERGADKPRIVELYEQLNSENQLALLKIMSAMAGGK